MSPPDLLIVGAAQVVTLAGSSHRPRAGAALADPAAIDDAFVAVRGERIAAVGPMRDLPAPWRAAADAARGHRGRRGTRVIDARGRAVVPGFVDPHTHAVYAGDRTAEFRMRLAGASYAEIGRSGGGILSTVRATRAAGKADLVACSRPRLDRMLLTGTTTAEVKSGYGLALEAELTMLEAIAELDRSHPLDLVPTFMGAHEVPPEFRGNPDGYVAAVVDHMLPAVAERRLARFNDVFCEAGVFSVAQSRRVLEAGWRLGLRPKIHADELAPGFGGAELAAEVGCISADHLLQVSDAGLEALARAGTIPVLLPGTAFALMLRDYAPARRMVERGLPVALGTDCNPGSCPIESMAVIIGLACLQMRLAPAEALAAATINAAHALGLAAEVGSIEPGKQADLLILSEPSYEAIPYRFGANLVEMVVKRGRVVAERGRVVAPGGRALERGRGLPPGPPGGRR